MCYFPQVASTYIELLMPGHEPFSPIAIYDELVTLRGQPLAEPFPTFSRNGAIASILKFLDILESLRTGT
jgi:hypothetical protein